MRRRIITLTAALLIGTASIVPAQAQFFGGIVFDPSNYAQNILTAARTLQTVNNQIRQLENEAQMLINGATDLIALDFNASEELGRLLGEITALMDEANAISYDMEKTDQIFQTQYPKEYADWSGSEIAQAAELQWQTSRNAYHDTLLIQSKIVETVKADTQILDQMLSESAGAQGNLSAVQAGNQIAALNTKQNMQMQELLVAQYRAETLERARRMALEKQAKIDLERFVGPATAYTSSN